MGVESLYPLPPTFWRSGKHWMWARVGILGNTMRTPLIIAGCGASRYQVSTRLRHGGTK